MIDNNCIVIKVEGDIYASSGAHWALGWSCGSLGSDNFMEKHNGTFSYNKNTQIIQGDLLLNEDRTSIPYAIYYASGGISTSGKNGSNIICGDSYWGVKAIYDKEIDGYKRLLNFSKPNDLYPIVNRGIFTGIIGALELFLCDYLLGMIFSPNNQYLSNFINRYCKSCGLLNTVNNADSVHRYVYDLISTRHVFHQFEKVKNIYQQTMDFDFPKTDQFEEYIIKRHDIIHRSGLSIKDRMSIINPTNTEIEELISISTKLVEEIISKTIK